jgi:hypothetical protein
MCLGVLTGGGPDAAVPGPEAGRPRLPQGRAAKGAFLGGWQAIGCARLEASPWPFIPHEFYLRTSAVVFPAAHRFARPWTERV